MGTILVIDNDQPRRDKIVEALADGSQEATGWPEFRNIPGSPGREDTILLVHWSQNQTSNFAFLQAGGTYHGAPGVLYTGAPNRSILQEQHRAAPQHLYWPRDMLHQEDYKRFGQTVGKLIQRADDGDFVTVWGAGQKTLAGHDEWLEFHLRLLEEVYAREPKQEACLKLVNEMNFKKQTQQDGVEAKVKACFQDDHAERIAKIVELRDFLLERRYEQA